MHDLVALGEVMLRLSIPSPARFETVRQLDVQIGGAEANVAAACARLGLRAAWTPALGLGPRRIVEQVLREAAAISFDVNYRAALWSPADARAFAASVLPAARHVFLGQSEAETVFGLTGAPEATVETIARLAPKASVALLQGEAGSLVLDGG